MNWYSIFYWLTVGDQIKTCCDVLSITFFILCAISLVFYFISTNAYSENVASKRDGENSDEAKSWKVWVSAYKRSFTLCCIVAVVSTLLGVFIPSKKDSLVIIAGGSVGNFITKDSSARAIPSEAMNLLRAKIQEETKQVLSNVSKKSPEEMTKEELLEIVKQQVNK